MPPHALPLAAAVGAGLLLAAAAAVLALCFRVARKVARPSVRDESRCLAYQVEAGNLPPDWPAGIPHEDFLLGSPNGYPLFCRYLPCGRTTPRCVAIVHGYRATHASVAKYARFLYHPLGYDVLLHDNRAHGRSGGRGLTYGASESRDLAVCVDWLRRRKAAEGHAPEDVRVGVCGESMGAGIAAAYAAGADPAPDFLHLDCPYSDLDRLLRRIGRRDYALAPWFVEATFPLVRLLLRRVYGVDLAGASVASAVARVDAPVFVAHGEDDRFIPCDMGREVAAAAKRSAFFLGRGAGHAQCLERDRTGYAAAFAAFLADVGDAPCQGPRRLA